MYRTAPSLPIEDLDAMWAAVIGCEPGDLRSGRLMLRMGGDQEMLDVFVTPDGGVVLAPFALLAQIEPPTLDQALEPSWWAMQLKCRPSDLAVQGPMTIWYATRETFIPEPHRFVRALRRRDAEALARFDRILKAREPETYPYWQIGGREVAHTRLWGAYHEGKLVAVAGARLLSSDVAEIGVSVLPTMRRRGYGTAVVSAAASALFEQVRLVQLRTLNHTPGAD
ncbi:GNAT family N-acetyltransferase, partial [Ardenticatena maritima]